MQTGLKVQLSVFMFLQYFIWGSWYVEHGRVPRATTLQVRRRRRSALAYGAFAIGVDDLAVLRRPDRRPLLRLGEAARRARPARRGGALFLLPQVDDVRDVLPAAHPVLRDVRADARAGQLALAAPPARREAGLPARQDPLRGRVDRRRRHASACSTASSRPIQFYLAGGVSIAFGLFSFTLPHTPPKKVGANVSLGEILGLDALALMKKRSFAIFIGVHVPDLHPALLLLREHGHLPRPNWSGRTSPRG